MIQITILHTNDLHGRIQQLLRIATLVRNIRSEVEAKGGYCVFVDAGDVEDTTWLESSLTKGSATGFMLRGAGCEHVALGNAVPVRYGPEAVKDLATRFGKPFLCANLHDQSGKLVEGVVPSSILSFGSFKVGLIGLTDPLGVYKDVFHLSPKSPVDVLPDLIAQAKEAGAKLIILLSHLSSVADQGLTESVPGIDVIIGGHDHKILCPPLVANGTIIAQAGEYGQFLGRLDLDVDPATGQILSHKGEMIQVDESIPPDPQAQKSVEVEQKRMQKIVHKRVGVLESPIEFLEDSECAAGNLLADALLDRMKGAQIALTLAGHWTTGLDKGVLTRGALYAAIRSTANPARLSLSGEQIRAFLRKALEPENAARKLRPLRGSAVGMPHVAGMRIQYDPNDISSLEISIGDEALIDNKTYIVASTDTELSEYIDYLVIPDGQIEFEIPTILPEMLEDYIRERSPFMVHQDRRIVLNLA
jgi:5'-nucleotidase